MIKRGHLNVPVVPVFAAAAAPGDQVRQTVDNLLVILKGSEFNTERNRDERRAKTQRGDLSKV
jgi:hypothetical protein